MAKKKKSASRAKKRKSVAKKKTKAKPAARPAKSRKAKPASGRVKRKKAPVDQMEVLEAEISRYKKEIEKPGTSAPVTFAAVGAAEKKEFTSERKEYSVGKYRQFVFYAFSSLLCAAVLAFLFGGWLTFVVYFVFSGFLWWWSHQSHVGRSSLLKSVIFLGVLLPVLYMFYLAFDDLLSLLVFAVYALSFIIAVALYIYHVGQGKSGLHASFSRTFVVVFYSHAIALAAGSLVAYLLSFVLGDSFRSMLSIIIGWFLPSVLVYFFLTKFLYLRFFDRVHIKRDVLKGLAHGAVYSVVLVLLLVIAYLLSAFQIVGMEQATYEDSFTRIATTLANTEFELSMAASDAPTNLLGFKVSYDLLSLSDQAELELRQVKAGLVTSFSFRDYVSDSYFTALRDNRMKLSVVAGRAYGIGEVTDDLVREYSRMGYFEKRGLFDDGSDSLDMHYNELRNYMEGVYTPYVEPFRFARLRQKVASSQDSYAVLLADGELQDFNRLYMEEMAWLEPGDSRFSKAVYRVIYRTVVFRDLMVLAFNSIVMQVEESIEPEAYRELYDLRGEGAESVHSSVLRYRILMSNHEAARAFAAGG